MSAAAHVLSVRDHVPPDVAWRHKWWWRGTSHLWLAAVVLAAGGQFLFMHSSLLHGGLYLDDWADAAIRHFHGSSVLLQRLANADHERPLEAVYLTVTTAASGTSPQLHAFWGFLTHLLCVISVALVARMLGMRRVAAAVLGLLVMLFPFSDSLWLWYTASQASVSIAFAASGVLLALHGLRAERAWAWHAAATMAFVASVLTYQVIIFAIFLMLAVYWPRTDRRTAIRLWVKDVFAVVCASFLPALITGSRGVAVAPPLVLEAHALLHHGGLMITQGASVLALALVSLGHAHRVIVLPVALVVVALATWRALRSRGVGREYLRTWLSCAIVGLAIVVAAYAIYVPTDLFYVPLAAGEGNRVNALAGVGLCLIVLSLAMLVAGLLTPRRFERWTAILGALLTVPVIIGYVQRIDHDMALWNGADDIQRHELEVLHRLGRPSPGSTDFVGGGVGETAPGVFAFGEVASFNYAVQLAWNDSTIQTWPILSEVPLRCTSTGVVPEAFAFDYGPQQATTYRSLVVTDLATATRRRVRNLTECRQAFAAAAPYPPQS